MARATGNGAVLAASDRFGRVEGNVHSRGAVKPDASKTTVWGWPRPDGLPMAFHADASLTQAALTDLGAYLRRLPPPP